MTAGGGKRAGTRRGAQPQRLLQPMALVLALGITGAVIGWGYLVYLAIMHGQAIRSGDNDAWLPGATSGLGAVACLFLGFILVARLLRTLATSPSTHSSSSPATGGGHRVGGHQSGEDKRHTNTQPARMHPTNAHSSETPSQVTTSQKANSRETDPQETNPKKQP